MSPFTPRNVPLSAVPPVPVACISDAEVRTKANPPIGTFPSGEKLAGFSNIYRSALPWAVVGTVAPRSPSAATDRTRMKRPAYLPTPSCTTRTSKDQLPPVMRSVAERSAAAVFFCKAVNTRCVTSTGSFVFRTIDAVKLLPFDTVAPTPDTALPEGVPDASSH